MRIIAGDFKGRKLYQVTGKGTRPTSDRVKESAFQIMGPFFTSGKCLDLFAGSGSLGLEALSRGMEEGVFVERARRATETIKKNIQLLGIDKQTEILQLDVFHYLNMLPKNKKFDLILVDPPYNKINYKQIIKKIEADELLDHKGLMYCEHDPNEKLPLQLEDLKIYRQMNYGRTVSITIYERKGDLQS